MGFPLGGQQMGGGGPMMGGPAMGGPAGMGGATMGAGPVMGGPALKQMQTHIDSSKLKAAARKCKDALGELQSLTHRYMTEVNENIKKAFLKQAKNNLRYHMKCVESYSRQVNGISSFDPSAATQTFISNLG